MQKGVDHVGVAVVYFCHDGKGNIVLAKRSAQARDEQGTWDIGGGGLDFGDSVINTLRKEIKEEYCADILQYEFLGYRDVQREHQGKKTHWVALDFKVLVNPEQVKIGEPEKFDNIGWFTLRTLPSPILSQLPTFLEKYKNKL